MLRADIRNGLTPGLNQPEAPAPASNANRPQPSTANNNTDGISNETRTHPGHPGEGENTRRILAALSQPTIQELSQRLEIENRKLFYMH